MESKEIAITSVYYRIILSKVILLMQSLIDPQRFVIIFLKNLGHHILL